MDLTAHDLYADGPAVGAKARILLIHFDGAIDAGGAGRMAVAQMLRSLHNERVATFDPDALIDYRSHRPVTTVENWVSTQVRVPEIVLDLVEDDMGHPILVLHGAEPDARWESFARAVGHIAERSGVEITFSLHGVPSGVPHTRPTPVHVQATDSSLLPDQTQMANYMQFPSPLSTFIQVRLAQRGIGGIALLGAVPYYMSDTGYPAAASALLRSLSKFADLSLPVGDLEQGAAQDQEAIEKLVEDNPEISHTVGQVRQGHRRRHRGLPGAGDPREGRGRRRGSPPCPRRGGRVRAGGVRAPRHPRGRPGPGGGPPQGRERRRDARPQAPGLTADRRG